MISAQLFFFLGVIFLLGGTSIPDQPWLSGWEALALCAAGCGLFALLARRAFAAVRAADAWFRAEKRVIALAFVGFLGLLYALDLKYRLDPLVAWAGEAADTLGNFLGLLVFFALLALGWSAGWARHQALFGTRAEEHAGNHGGRLAFLRDRVRENLPLVLPWLLIMACLELLRFLLPRTLFESAAESA